ncbi:VanZ family protein [Pengzhenrongella sp.]|jgi:VanZ family protein|uniref:VanZ family protein n=1 Tax=Pengzhenrongella sp. TaxID=2888820 RepID=UPI002F92E35B
MPSDSQVHLPRRGLAWALAGYAVVLTFVLGWPTPVDAPLHTTLLAALRWLHDQGLPSWIGYTEVEFSANISLFVPVGVLLTLALRREWWWVAVLAGFGFSTLAELAQGSLLPERFAMPRDVVANTLGTLLGSGLAVLISRRQARAHQRAAHRITFERVSTAGAGRDPADADA